MKKQPKQPKKPKQLKQLKQPSLSFVLEGKFRRRWWLISKHLETIAAMRGGEHLPYRSEVVTTRDGDEVLMNWLPGEDNKPLLVIFHGLEGCCQSHTVRMIASHFAAQGWTIAAPHFRSCGHLNLLPRAYHAGDGQDVKWMIEYSQALYPRPQTFAVGVSLGGNALIQCLAMPESKKLLSAAATISAPLNMIAAAHAINHGFGHMIYGRHFMKLLRVKVQQKSRRYPAICNMKELNKARTVGDFDRIYTAPTHGFADATDYWTKASSAKALLSMTTPMLCINAQNDPIVPVKSLPKEAAATVKFCQPHHGGHGSFCGTPKDWLPVTVSNFFTNYAQHQENPGIPHDNTATINL
ncbi:MAG: YheT family hydrolase [Gammaproteobacteria bacterium WSBS_2016_MAG_OTU1]